MSKNRTIKVVVTIVTAFLTLCVFTDTLVAQTQPGGVKFAPVEKGLILPDIDRSEFHSKFTDHDYDVYVLLPASYSKGDQRYPVLYVPDIDEGFLILKSAIRIMGLAKLTDQHDILEEFILVGVPLKWRGPEDWGRERAFDLTPTDVEAFNTTFSKQIGGQVHSGGAAMFLRTLKEELIPFIESKYRVNSDRGLCGISFGGLFASYVLLNDRNTFSRYLIGSPSLWWDKGMILKAAFMAESGKTPRGRVFLSVGAEENEEEMVAPLKSFVSALKSHSGSDLQLESHIFDGENHFTVAQATLSRGLRFLYAKPQPKP